VPPPPPPPPLTLGAWGRPPRPPGPPGPGGGGGGGGVRAAYRAGPRTPACGSPPAALRGPAGARASPGAPRGARPRPGSGSSARCWSLAFTSRQENEINAAYNFVQPTGRAHPRSLRAAAYGCCRSGCPGRGSRGAALRGRCGAPAWCCRWPRARGAAPASAASCSPLAIRRRVLPQALPVVTLALRADSPRTAGRAAGGGVRLTARLMSAVMAKDASCGTVVCALIADSTASCAWNGGRHRIRCVSTGGSLRPRRPAAAHQQLPQLLRLAPP